MSDIDLLRVYFDANVDRVSRLIHLHRRLVDGARVTESRVAYDDVLRAAVVLLHAALETVLRAVEEETILPMGASHHLKGIKIPLDPDEVEGHKKADKVTLVELAEYRGRTVDDVIHHAVTTHLDRQTYNNIRDLKVFEARMSLAVVDRRPDHKKSIMGMMKRRHLIAHRADQNPDDPVDPQPVDVNVVQRWEDAVTWYAHEVLEARRRER